MNELALFAGAGGGILGGRLLGWRTMCAVEIDPYRRKVLLQRQKDGLLSRFPIWDDIRTFDGHIWQGEIDIITGGFPCQDISCAGTGAGISGERSGLWKEMARVIGEVRPAYVLVENSPFLVSRGLDVVLADLAALGFNAEWGVVGACNAGAPHKRERIWILGHSCSLGWKARRDNNAEHERTVSPPDGKYSYPLAYWWENDPADLPYTDGTGCKEQRSAEPERTEYQASECGNRWGIESRLGRVANGVAHRVDRLEAVGLGQVPAVVGIAWNTLMKTLTERH